MGGGGVGGGGEQGPAPPQHLNTFHLPSTLLSASLPLSFCPFVFTVFTACHHGTSRHYPSPPSLPPITAASKPCRGAGHCVCHHLTPPNVTTGDQSHSIRLNFSHHEGAGRGGEGEDDEGECVSLCPRREGQAVQVLVSVFVLQYFTSRGSEGGKRCKGVVCVACVRGVAADSTQALVSVSAPLLAAVRQARSAGPLHASIDSPRHATPPKHRVNSRSGGRQQVGPQLAGLPTAATRPCLLEGPAC